MVEYIRGLPGVFGLVTPAAYRSQVNSDSKTEERPSQLVQSNNLVAGVTVTISEEALAMLHAYGQQGNQHQASQQNLQNQSTNEQEEQLQNPNTDGKNASGSATQELSEEEKKEVERLKTLDRQIRAHEQAHLAAAGNLATSGTKFEYKTGPDGKQYAVAGEVEISMREGKTPEETIRIAEQVQRAALAPADPSPQDRRVAADAASKAMQARMELLQETNEKLAESISSNTEISASNIENTPEEQRGTDNTAAAAVNVGEAFPQHQQNTFIPTLSTSTTSDQQQSNQFTDQLITSQKSSNQVSIASSAEKASANLRGRQEMGKISRGERGIFMGVQFSTFSIQT